MWFIWVGSEINWEGDLVHYTTLGFAESFQQSIKLKQSSIVPLYAEPARLLQAP